MVGWDTSKSPEMSHTQASPPAWLATKLNRRSRTGSANALSLAATSVAASVDSGSRTTGAYRHAEISLSGNCMT